MRSLSRLCDLHLDLSRTHALSRADADICGPYVLLGLEVFFVTGKGYRKKHCGKLYAQKWAGSGAFGATTMQTTATSDLKLFPTARSPRTTHGLDVNMGEESFFHRFWTSKWIWSALASCELRPRTNLQMSCCELLCLLNLCSKTLAR